MDYMDKIGREAFVAFRRAVMKADEAIQASGETGTKTWLREYLFPELEKEGITITLNRGSAEQGQPDADTEKKVETVGDLISELQKMDPNLPVRLDSGAEAEEGYHFARVVVNQRAVHNGDVDLHFDKLKDGDLVVLL